MADATPIKVRKLGHVVYTVTDIERTTRFWTDIMGFSVSDRNERGMVFLRNGSDHHTIALVPAHRGPGPMAHSFSTAASEPESRQINSAWRL